MKIEWLILADYAQVIENKLYVQGGGWDRLTVNTGFPLQRQVGIAASITVPWNETNQQGSFEIEIQDDDGKRVANFGGAFKVGRPADHPPGQDQRTQIAANMSLPLKERGTYAIIARLEGREEARTSFNVVAGPLLAAKQPPQPSGPNPS